MMDAVGDGDGCGRRCRGGGAGFGGEVIRVWNFQKKFEKNLEKKFSKKKFSKKKLRNKKFSTKNFRK